VWLYEYKYQLGRFFNGAIGGYAMDTGMIHMDMMGMAQPVPALIVNPFTDAVSTMVPMPATTMPMGGPTMAPMPGMPGMSPTTMAPMPGMPGMNPTTMAPMPGMPGMNPTTMAPMPGMNNPTTFIPDMVPTTMIPGMNMPVQWNYQKNLVSLGNGVWYPIITPIWPTHPTNPAQLLSYSLVRDSNITFFDNHWLLRAYSNADWPLDWIPWMIFAIILSLTVALEAYLIYTLWGYRSAFKAVNSNGSNGMMVHTASGKAESTAPIAPLEFSPDNA